MTTAILIGGIVTVVLIGLAMRRPDWRLPALLIALLVIPGNVDNVLPQMRLDPHAIRDATAPVVSFVDLLIAWGLFLAIGERRLHDLPRRMRLLLGAAGIFAFAAVAVTALNVLDGLDASAAVRGALMMARVPAILALSFAMRDEMQDGRPLAIAAAVGAIGLIGNGLYTSASLETTRFTAATFGRNGFSLVLILAAILATGAGVEMRRARSHGSRTWMIAFLIAAAALFGAIATGTRASLLMSVPALAASLVVNRSWWSRRGVRGLAMLAVGAIVVAGAATLWTTDGARALSALLNPGGTVDIITDPESEPDYSPVRTRTRWWGYAMSMARDDPLTGVGAYQWNHRRYALEEPDVEPVVADPHNTYLQMVAEFGVPVLTLYLVTLVSLVVGVTVAAFRRSSPVRVSAAATLVMAGALMIPFTELTNSHLFNVRIGALTWLLLGAAVALTLAAPIRFAARDRSAGSGQATTKWSAITEES